MQDYLIQIITGLCTTGLVGVVLSLWRIYARVARLGDISEKMDEVHKMTVDLHEWHDHSDADGVKVWYIRKSLEKAIFELSGAVDALNKTTANNLTNTHGTAKVLDRITDRLERNGVL